jgi:hypothetical protein
MATTVKTGNSISDSINFPMSEHQVPPDVVQLTDTIPKIGIPHEKLKRHDYCLGC